MFAHRLRSPIRSGSWRFSTYEIGTAFYTIIWPVSNGVFHCHLLKFRRSGCGETSVCTALLVPGFESSKSGRWRFHWLFLHLPLHPLYNVNSTGKSNFVPRPYNLRAESELQNNSSSITNFLKKKLRCIKSLFSTIMPDYLRLFYRNSSLISGRIYLI